MKAFVKQSILPYRGEPTRRQRINLDPGTHFLTLYEQKMGDPNRKVGKRGEDKKKRKSPRPWTEEDVRTMVELRQQGLSIRQIAAKIGRAKGNVQKRLKEVEV